MSSYSAFGDVHMRILWDGDAAAMPGWEQEVYSATNHIPGSNRNITFLLGNGPYRRSFEVMCDTVSSFTNLKLLRATEATLRVPAAMNDMEDSGVVEVVYFGDTYAEIADVLLLSLDNVRRWVDGTVTALATFQRDEPEDDEEEA